MDILTTEEMIKSLTLGEKGEISFHTTGHKCLDLFGTVNRGTPMNILVEKFVDACNENFELCVKILLNFRDIRNGKGEKKISRIMLFIIKLKSLEIYQTLLPLFIEVGYWKDVLYLAKLSVLFGVSDDIEVLFMTKQLLQDQLRRSTGQSISLCAKWAPSENSHFDQKPFQLAKKIYNVLGLSAKRYRKFLTSLRKDLDLIEHKLSQKCFTGINFRNIPSKAHMIYSSALKRETNAKGQHDALREHLVERYNTYLANLAGGNEKANFKGLMPHEIVRKIRFEEAVKDLLQNQWASIREEIHVTGVFKNCVSIVDVSGSMEGLPMDVAIALGILVSECAEGPFQHKVITFHEDPQFVDLRNCVDLQEKVKVVSELPWGGTTNLEKVFDQMLEIADREIVYAVPERLFIFTDMQFDQVSGKRLKTFDKIADKFAEKGYKMPQVVCWNLRTVEAVPFMINDMGVAIMSGYSAELMKSFLNETQITPMTVFLNAIKNYNVPEDIVSYQGKFVVDHELVNQLVSFEI